MRERFLNFNHCTSTMIKISSLQAGDRSLCLWTVLALLLLNFTFSYSLQGEGPDTSKAVTISIDGTKLSAKYNVPRGYSIYIGYKTDRDSWDHSLIATKMPVNAPFEKCSLDFSFGTNVNNAITILVSDYSFKSPATNVDLLGMTSGSFSKEIKSEGASDSPIADVKTKLEEGARTTDLRTEIAEWVITFKNGQREHIKLESWLGKDAEMIQSQLTAADKMHPTVFNALHWSIFNPKISNVPSTQ